MGRLWPRFLNRDPGPLGSRGASRGILSRVIMPPSEVGTHAFASSYYGHLDPQADISVIAVAQIYIWII